MKRLPLVLVLVTLWVVVAVLPAGADPQAESFELECVGVPSNTITANSGFGLWTPGFAVDGTGVYIPYRFVYTATFYPDAGGSFDLGPDVFEKKAPKNTESHPHGECTFEGEEQLVNDPDLGSGLLVFSAEAHVFWTGR